MRKCRNWQTSKTKDLVINAIVWVQVPSSAVGKSLEIKGFFLFHKKVTIQVTKKRRNCNCVYDIAFGRFLYITMLYYKDILLRSSGIREHIR